MWDQLWESREDSPYDLAFDRGGTLLIATGGKGKIYRLEGEPLRATLVARAGAQQVTAFLLMPIGSAGDTFPFIGLGQRLVQRGHRVQMVANGLGVTLVPQMALEAGILRGLDLPAVPLAGEHPFRRIGLAWRRRSGRAETFRRLAEALRDEAGLKVEAGLAPASAAE